MRKYKFAWVICICALVVLCAAIVESMIPEGLPITGVLVNGPENIGNGYTRVIYETIPFFPTQVDNSTPDGQKLLHDAGGLTGTYMGSYGTRMWVNCPSGYTLSLFPGHLLLGIPYKYDQWVDKVSEYKSTHPDVNVVSQNQTIYQVQDDGSLMPVDHMYTFTMPIVDCDPGSWKHPFVIRYEGVFSGDVSGFTFDSSITHYLYRVSN